MRVCVWEGGGEGWLEFRILDLAKNPDGTDI